MFKICSIGCGHMARNGHGPAFKKYAEAHPDTCLAACCDIVLASAESFKEKFGFQRAYTNYETMLKKSPMRFALFRP